MRSQRLVALFLLGLVLFNYPFLGLFSRSETVGGIPLLYLYLFAAWALLIGLMALVIERPSRSPDPPAEESGDRRFEG